MPETSFEQLNESAAKKEEQKIEYQNRVNSQVDRTGMIHGKYDRRRYARKTELAELVAIWREELKNDTQVLRDKKLKQILADIEEYTNLDVTATHGTTMNQLDDVNRVYIAAKISTWNESGKLAKLLEETKEYLKRTEERLKKEENPEKVEILGQRLMMAENINLFLEDQVSGFLPPPPGGARHIKGKDKDIKSKFFLDGMWDCRDKPLFPHDPSIADIRQGNIGNCYMAAAIAGAVRKNPDVIKEMMHDNGDGTVTVRFFRRVPLKGYPEVQETKEMEPFYVTVDKSAPAGMGALNSLWVSMIEKAAVVAGIEPGRMYEGPFAQPVPENIDELYEEYKKLPEYLRPSKMECPWLYDKDGNFVKWQPKYEHIGEGGRIELFAETLLGTDYKGFSQDMSTIRSNASKDIAYDYMMLLLEEGSSKDFANKVRAVLDGQEDSIKRRQNVSKLLTAMKANLVDYRTYQPVLNNSGDLEGLKNKVIDRSYQIFAQAIENALDDVLFESNIKYNEKNEFTDQMVSKVKESIEKINNYSSEERKNINWLLMHLTGNKNKIAEGISGKGYPLSYLKQYEEIKSELEKGNFIGASTPSAKEGDSKTDGGLNYQHGYSVIGVEEETIDGKNYKFVVMRNPHGKTHVPQYDYSYTPPKAIGSKDIAAEGIFKMELSHFMNNIDSLDFNGKELSKEEKKADKEMVLHLGTLHHLSKYMRLFAIMDKDLTKALEKVKEKSKNMNAFVKSLRGLAGMGGDIPVSYVAGVISHAENILQDEKVNPAIQRILKTSLKLVNMLRNSVNDPIDEIGKGISGYPMTVKKSLYDFFDLDMQNEFKQGVQFGEKEATNIMVILKKANYGFVSSSKQFKEMSNRVKNFSVAYKALRAEPNENNMEAYIQSLKNLGEASKAYLDFKAEQRRQPDGSIIYKTDLEKTRVDAAKKIMDYAVSKGEKLEKSYVNMAVVHKIQKILFPDKETKLQDYIIMDTVNSLEFKKVVEGKTTEDLKKLLQNEGEMKKLAEAFNKARLGTAVRPIIAYRNDTAREFQDVFDNGLSTEEEKINAAAKYVYGHMVWVADTKGRISEQAVQAEEKNFIERIKKDPDFQSYLKNLNRQWVTDEKNDNYLDGIRKGFEQRLRINENTSLERMLFTKTTEIQKREEQLQKEEEIKRIQQKEDNTVNNEMDEAEQELNSL